MSEEKKQEEKKQEEKKQEDSLKKEEKKEEPKKTKKENSKEEKKEASKEEKKPKDDKKEESKEEEVEVPEKFKDLVESIEEMKVSDLAELVKILEKKFGVSAAPQMAAAPAQGGGSEGEEKEEKSEYDVELVDIGKEKIKVIKATRDITQKGLKEAKDLVDSASSSPQVIKEGVKKEEAEEMKKKFEEAGAKVELK